jgi:hypothetical protein
VFCSVLGLGNNFLCAKSRPDQPLEILCEDHIGTYLIPFLCQWSDGTWQNAKIRRSIEAAVIGWREARRDQR